MQWSSPRRLLTGLRQAVAFSRCTSARNQAQKMTHSVLFYVAPDFGWPSAKGCFLQFDGCLVDAIGTTKKHGSWPVKWRINESVQSLQQATTGFYAKGDQRCFDHSCRRCFFPLANLFWSFPGGNPQKPMPTSLSMLSPLGMSKLRKARAFSSPPRTGFYWRVIVRRQTLGAV
jgi:hypothetical protein